ncbi:MAG: hypothetical protein KC416_11235, partial [Myxococcales bacterium]|nr:hypothetical protein [Myxococcales bacterium]
MAKHGIATKAPKGAIALHIVTPAEFPKWKKGQDATVGRWLKETGFKGKDGNVRMLPGKDGRMAGAVLVTKEPTDPFAYAALPTRLPAGTYRFAKAPKGDVADAAVLGWALGCYRFEQYKKAKGSLA